MLGLSILTYLLFNWDRYRQVAVKSGDGGACNERISGDIFDKRQNTVYVLDFITVGP